MLIEDAAILTSSNLRPTSYSPRTNVAGHPLSSSAQLLSSNRFWIISSTSPGRVPNTSARISMAACSSRALTLLLLLTLARLGSIGPACGRRQGHLTSTPPASSALRWSSPQPSPGPLPLLAHCKCRKPGRPARPSPAGGGPGPGRRAGPWPPGRSA